MTSNMPYTYDDVTAALAGTGRDEWYPRPNTKVVLGEDKVADVYLHGGHIAELRSNGTVKVLADADMSNTTRNRLNDVLSPLGWKIAFRVDETDDEYEYPVIQGTRGGWKESHTYMSGSVIKNSKGN